MNLKPPDTSRPTPDKELMPTSPHQTPRVGARFFLISAALIVSGSSGCVTEELPGDSSVADSGTLAGIPLPSAVGDCAVDTAARHTDPVGLVEEFVRRDAEGPFEREDIARAWHASAVTCVDRASSDHYEIISAFRVTAGPRTRDSARVFVTRERLFRVSRDQTGKATALIPARATWVDTVLVLRTTLGWRIHDIDGGAHRLPSRARHELPDLVAADRRRLDSLAMQPGG